MVGSFCEGAGFHGLTQLVIGGRELARGLEVICFSLNIVDGDLFLTTCLSFRLLTALTIVALNTPLNLFSLLEFARVKHVVTVQAG